LKSDVFFFFILHPKVAFRVHQITSMMLFTSILRLLRPSSPYRSKKYCVSIAFAGALPDSLENRHLLEKLKSLSDAVSKRLGHVTLTAFRELLLANQQQLGLSLGRCVICAQPLGKVLMHKTGIVIVSDGRGHAVGISCVQKRVVDADPCSVLRGLDLNEPGAKQRLEEGLGLEKGQWVNAMHVALETAEGGC
jgi:hypothetical protein